MEEYQPHENIFSAEKGVEPLPPVEATENAKEVMDSWGITPEQQAKLSQEILPTFRYDLVHQKLSEITKDPVYKYQKENGNDAIIIPNFFYKDGNVGQCLDISTQMVASEQMNDWLDEVNADRDDSNKITISRSMGTSRDYFHRSENNHFWNSLQKGKDDENLITLDAALQEISTPQENGYKEKEKFRVSSPTKMQMMSNIVVEIGAIDMGGDKSSWDWESLGERAIIGMSEDGDHVIGLSFSKDIASNKIVPVVSRMNSEGEYTMFVADESGKAQQLGMTSELGRADNLTEEESKEIQSIIDIVKEIDIKDSIEADGHITNNDGFGDEIDLSNN